MPALGAGVCSGGARGYDRAADRMEIVELRRLRALVPKPSVSPEVEAKLRAARPQPLVALAVDPSEPWWRRRAFALALRGRVPVDRAALLLDRVSDAQDVAEIRRALLEVLSEDAAVAGSIPLLEWLRAQEGREQAYGMEEAILAARARLGDRAAVPRLATLAYDPWWHRRQVGEAAIDALVEAYGLAAVLRALGVDELEALICAGARPEDRLLGLRLAHRQGLPIDAALADGEVAVARAAFELMIDGSGATDEALLARAAEGREAAAQWRGLEPPPTRHAGGCFWSLCVLAQRGHDVREQWRALGSSRMDYEGVPEDVRLAILRQYVPGQRQTDPRLLLEAACVELPPAPDEAEQLARATAALAGAGLSPATPTPAGDLHQQGEGTYHAIETSEGRVDVSTLGPFVRSEAEVVRAREALASAGFRVLDDVTLGVRITGLPVYFFGSREPLSVDDLLFYWQD